MSVFEPSAQEHANLRQRGLRIVLWLAGIAIVLAILQVIGVDPIAWLKTLFSTMGKVSTGSLIGAITAQTINLLLTGLAYVAIWRSAYPQAKSVPAMQIVTCYIVSIALNGVLPLSIGTWTMLFMFLAIIPGATAAGMASGFGVSKIFFAVTGVITYGYLFYTISGAISQAVGGVENHLGALALIATLGVVLVVVLLKTFRQRFLPGWGKLKQGAAIMRTPRKLVLWVLVPQAIGFVAENAAVGFFMHGYGIPVSVHSILLNDAANSLATLTAVTPGGLGATQALTTLALSGIADPSTIAAYSLTQQLVLTAWSVLVALVAVVVFFGWRGGRTIITNSLVTARGEIREKRDERKDAKAERHAERRSERGASSDR